MGSDASPPMLPWARVISSQGDGAGRQGWDWGELGVGGGATHMLFLGHFEL